MGNVMNEKTTYGGILLIADREHAGYRKGMESVAGMLFDLAKSCTNSGQFETGISAAEAERKNNLAQKAVKLGWDVKTLKDNEKIPGCWKQAKSELLAMFRPVVDKGFGIHPSEFKTFSEMHIKLNELRKAKKTPRKKDDSTTADAATDALGEIPTGIKGEFYTYVSMVMELPEETQKVILDAFSKMVEASLDGGVEVVTTVIEEEGEEIVTTDDLRDLEEVQIAQAVGGN